MRRYSAGIEIIFACPIGNARGWGKNVRLSRILIQLTFQSVSNLDIGISEIFKWISSHRYPGFDGEAVMSLSIYRNTLR